MVDVGYWIETFLSTTLEIRVFVVTLAAVAVGGLLTPDHRDPRGVALGVAVLTVALTLG